jgi:acetyltransferase-like isoleucine patch superfamily enzyme
MPINVSDKGTGNIITIPNEAKGNISIIIEGNNNTITIENLRRVDNLKITANGDGGKIEMDPFRVGNLSIGIKNGAQVSIGKGTSIEGAYILSDHGRVVSIGVDCMLSYNIQIRTTDSHGIYDVVTGERMNPANDVFIGDHVWIGQAALISKGTKLSRNTIVGASSFLQNKEFPPSCIVAGSPAKLIRTGVIWDRREAERVSFDGQSMDPQFQHWWDIAQEDNCTKDS